MANGFSITIGAVDNASNIIERVNKNMAAMQAPAKNFAKQISKFSELSGLRRVGQGFEQIASAGRGAVKSIAGVAEPLAAITGAASIAGMTALISSWADFQTQLGFSAQRLGLLPQQLSSIRGAAALAGTSGDAMQAGFQSLGDTLYDVANGQAPQAAFVLSRLGISLTDASGRARKAQDVLPKVADAIASMKDPLAQARLATYLFGGSAEAMLPVLRLGSAGMERLRQQALKYGGTTDEGVAAALRFRQAQAAVSQSVYGLTDAIATQLSPVISPLLLQLADWISHAKSSTFVTQTLGMAAREFGTWASNINLADIVRQVTDFGARADHAAQFLGGWKNVMEGIVAIKLAGWLFPVTAGALSLTRAVIGLTTAVPILSAAMAAIAATYLAYTRTREAYDDYVQRSADNQAALDSVAPNAAKQSNFDRLGAAHQLPAALQQHYDDAHRGNGRRGGAAVGGTARGPIDLSDYNGTSASAMAYFQSQGWTKAQAAGIVANIKAESGFKQNAVGDSGNAYGLGQWHADRQGDFARWAGHDIRSSSAAEQLGFYNFELTQGKEQAAGRLLRGATSASDAGAIVSRYDERPAAADEAARNRGAMAALLAATGPAALLTGPAQGAPGAAGANGKMDLNVTVKGAAVEHVSSRVSGNVNPPNVRYAMAGAG